MQKEKYLFTKNSINYINENLLYQSSSLLTPVFEYFDNSNNSYVDTSAIEKVDIKMLEDDIDQSFEIIVTGKENNNTIILLSEKIIVYSGDIVVLNIKFKSPDDAKDTFMEICYMFSGYVSRLKESIIEKFKSGHKEYMTAYEMIICATESNIEKIKANENLNIEKLKSFSENLDHGYNHFIEQLNLIKDKYVNYPKPEYLSMTYPSEVRDYAERINDYADYIEKNKYDLMAIEFLKENLDKVYQEFKLCVAEKELL